MSQMISNKPQIFPAFKVSPKPNLPAKPSDSHLKATPIKEAQKKTPVKEILEKMKTSREPPQIKDPFVVLKKLKVEPKKENVRVTEEDGEKEKQREEELLALLIDDIMSG